MSRIFDRLKMEFNGIGLYSLDVSSRRKSKLLIISGIRILLGDMDKKAFYHHLRFQLLGGYGEIKG
jgi:hypothetical protein